MTERPEAITRAERVLGASAVSWRRVESRGWSKNEHWTLVLANGTRAFVKEAWLEPSVTWLRQEREVYDLVSGPFIPALLGWEDGERPLLVLEDLSDHAHWPPPWRPGDVDAVLSTLAEVAAARTTGLPPVGGGWSGWAKVAEDPAPFLSLGLASPAWLERALPALLADVESADAGGNALLHCDVRSDNLCLRDGRVILVDWNHARIGDAAIDVAAWLPSLALENGPRPEEVAREIPRANAFAGSISGFFAAHAGLSPPEGAPLVRGFQLAQLEVALPWACSVLELPPPDLLR
jgi:hypothetical protein